MKKHSLNGCISDMIEERPGGPVEMEKGPGLGYGPEDFQAGREAVHWRTKRLNLRISGQAGRRLEVCAYRLGYPNINPVAKCLLEAAAGIEAADFYSLLAVMVREVEKSQARARAS